MKRILICILLILLLASSFMVVAHAEDSEEEASFDEVLSSLIDLLDSGNLNSDIDKYWQGLGLDGDTFKDKLLNIISGDYSVNYSNVFSGVLSLIFSGVKSLIPVLLIVCVIAVFYSIVRSLNPDFASEGMSQVLYFACYASILGLLAYKAFDIINSCFENVNTYARHMDAVFPLLLTVMAASGSTVSASVYQPAVAFLSNGITNIIINLVMPLTVFVLVFSSVSGLSSSLKMEKLESFFSSVIKWIIGICITVFTMFLSVQGITAGTYDGITLRVTKYAIGNSVPVVGGFLRDGTDLFLAAGLLIKNALGIFGLVFMLGIFISPIVELVAFILFLKLAAGIVEPFDNGKIANYMYSMAKNLNYILAAVLMVCFMYVITVVLMICTGGALL